MAQILTNSKLRAPLFLGITAIAFALATPVRADGSHAQAGGIQAQSGNASAAFDITHAKVAVQSDSLVFHMAVAGQAGASKPKAIGSLGNADVSSYVWPTSLDPAEVGFEAGSGILALAVTAHPDFDDTPLYDENKDGDSANDGGLWHSHWVVLSPDENCGPVGLKVADIPEGAKPALPATWPGLPILIDSPGWEPMFNGESVEVQVPFENMASVKSARFDGVTSGLRVNANVHAPLLCVVDAFDIASGDLSLPGKVTE